MQRQSGDDRARLGDPTLFGKYLELETAFYGALGWLDSIENLVCRCRPLCPTS